MLVLLLVFNIFTSFFSLLLCQYSYWSLISPPPSSLYCYVSTPGKSINTPPLAELAFMITTCNSLFLPTRHFGCSTGHNGQKNEKYFSSRNQPRMSWNGEKRKKKFLVNSSLWVFNSSQWPEKWKNIFLLETAQLVTMPWKMKKYFFCWNQLRMSWNGEKCKKKFFGNLNAYQLLRAVKLSEKNFDFRNCLMVYGSRFVPNLSLFAPVYQTIPVGWPVGRRTGWMGNNA